MIATYNVENECGQNPKTLGDWVKNFRLKRMQMKRKLRTGGNLRVCAILSTALMNAELKLRRKQQERFQKWLEFQTKINKNFELEPRTEFGHNLPVQRQQQSGKELVLVTNRSKEKVWNQSEEITNLWKCELLELDNFMRSMSSSDCKNIDDDQTISKKKECVNYQKNFPHRVIRATR